MLLLSYVLHTIYYLLFILYYIYSRECFVPLLKALGPRFCTNSVITISQDAQRAVKNSRSPNKRNEASSRGQMQVHELLPRCWYLFQVFVLSATTSPWRGSHCCQRSPTTHWHQRRLVLDCLSQPHRMKQVSKYRVGFLRRGRKSKWQPH